MFLFYSTWRVLARASLVTLGLMVAGGAARAQGRPHDPLTPAERQAAVRLAREDARVRQIAGNRAFDVAYAELLVAKPAATEPVDPMRPPPVPRQAEVLISVFEGDFTGIRVVVDLGRRAVTQVARVERPAAVAGGPPPGVIIPFSPREVEIARGLALGNANVRALTGAAVSELTIEFLPISTPEPELCPSGRCLELLFRRGNAYLTSTAVVDIPTRTVRIRRGPQ